MAVDTTQQSNDLDLFLASSDEDVPFGSRQRPVFESPYVTRTNDITRDRRHSVASQSTATSPALSAIECPGSPKSDEGKGLSDLSVSLSLEAIPDINVDPSESVTKRKFPVYPHGLNRIAELFVKRIDCAQSEAAVRSLLQSLPGVLSVGIDPITSVVIVEYDPKRTSAWAMMRSLQFSHFSPAKCSLRSAPYSIPESQLAQLVVALPPAYQTRYGRSIVQNHALAHDGLKSCVFSSDGKEMYLSYDSAVVGARQILKYINRAGVDCLAVDETEYGESKHEEAAFIPNGGIKLVVFVALILLWMDWSPPPTLERCMLNGIPGTSFVHLVLASCTSMWIGTPYLLTGFHGVRHRLFTSYVSLSLSTVVLFFISTMGLIAAWLLQTSSPDVTAVCTGLGSSLCYDQVCWILISWCLGQSVTQWLKRMLSKPMQNLEKCLHPGGYIRIVGEAGKLDLVPRTLVQKGDTIVVRSGETLWCDGVAESESVVKEPLVVSQLANCRPFTKLIGDSVYAGSLVMKGELRLRATRVGDTSLQQALITTKMMTLKSSKTHDRVQATAALYGAVVILTGIGFGLYGLTHFELTETTYSEDIKSIYSLLHFVCAMSAFWLGCMSLSLNSGTTAVPSCATGILTTLGGISTSADSLTQASKTEHVVINRSALAGPSALSIVSVAVCPTICRSIIETMHLPTNNTKSSNWKTLKASESGVQECDVEESCLDLIWSIVAHLETNGSHVETRIGQLLASEAKHHSLATGPPPSTVRVFPGKGIEGPSPTYCDSASIVNSPECRRGVAAVGSLEFILACHQFGMDRPGVGREGKSEWRSLQRWCEQLLNDGYDVILVAYNGLPLGAVVISTDYGEFLGPAFNFISNSLGCNVWLCTSASLLSAKSLSLRTGIPLERIISGASPQEKMLFVEKLLNRGEATCFVSGSSALLEVTAQRCYTMRTMLTTVLMGGELTKANGGADIIFPGYTVTGVVNLLVLSRMTNHLQRFGLVLSGIFLPLIVMVTAYCLTTSAWRLAPFIAVSAAIIAEWIILLNAMLLRTMRPATIARSTAQAESVKKYTQTTTNTTTTINSNTNGNRCYPGELVLPTKKELGFHCLVKSALSAAGAWIYHGFGRAKFAVSPKKGEENIDRILMRLSETEQGGRMSIEN